MKSAGLPRRCAPDGTTSHLTKAASCQVIGYRSDGGGLSLRGLQGRGNPEVYVVLSRWTAALLRPAYEDQW